MFNTKTRNTLKVWHVHSSVGNTTVPYVKICWSNDDLSRE